MSNLLMKYRKYENMLKINPDDSLLKYKFEKYSNLLQKNEMSKKMFGGVNFESDEKPIIETDTFDKLVITFTSDLNNLAKVSTKIKLFFETKDKEIVELQKKATNINEQIQEINNELSKRKFSDEDVKKIKELEKELKYVLSSIDASKKQRDEILQKIRNDVANMIDNFKKTNKENTKELHDMLKKQNTELPKLLRSMD